MTMKDEQIIREVVGRMADEAPPALDVDELGDPLMKRRPDSTWGRSTRRRIAAVGAATAFIAVSVFLTVVVGGSAPDGTTPVGAPAEATVDEFNGALTAALDVLREAPGIEGVEESYIQTHLAGKVWFSTRENGDAVVVQQTDVDVRDSAWWLTAASPPAVGDNITSEARAIVGGEYYQASTSDRESQPWRQMEREPPGTLAFGLIFFDDEFGPELRNQITPPFADVIRQDTANGGEIWTLNFSSNETHPEQRFYVHPDGHLASWTWQALGINVDYPADSTVLIDSGNVSYTPLAEPRPLQAPEVGTELNITAFDLPDDFPING